MTEKTIFCSYCGVELATVVFVQKSEMHIQNATVLAVCERCNKPCESKYDQHDLKAQKRELLSIPGINLPPAEAKTCEGCGGNIPPGQFCRACAAMGKKV